MRHPKKLLILLICLTLSMSAIAEPPSTADQEPSLWQRIENVLSEIWQDLVGEDEKPTSEQSIAGFPEPGG